jgi:tetratricopeptide (TPR) repeat protein
MHWKLIQGIQVALGQSRFEAAVELAQELIRLEPDNGWAQAMLCYAWSDLNRLDEAVAAGLEAVRLEPTSSDSHFSLGRALHYAECPQALLPIQEAVRLEPDEACFWWAISAVHYEARNGHQALEAAEQGLSIDAEEPDCLKQRALALALLGRAEEAIEAMETAFAQQPDYRFHEGAAGWVYLELRDWESAVVHLRRGLAIDPHSSWVHEGMGLALVGMEKVEAGVEHLLESLRLSPWGGRRARSVLKKLGRAAPRRRRVRWPANLWPYAARAAKGARDE